ncbi:MAG: PadR family transcriptional regulator [Candidatus Hodarchaeales archaeon]
MNNKNTGEKKAKKLVDKWIERYRRGSLRFFIVHLLLYKHHHEEADSNEHMSFHGYKLSQKIDEVTKGKWKPTTASIYPILKELNEANVLEKIPEVEQHQTGRTVIEYQLTPFGLIVAKKLEEARKNFAKAFITGKSKHMPPPLFPLGREFSPEEAQEIITKSSDDVLKNHRNHMNNRIKHVKDQLILIENELYRRNKEKESL